MTYSHHHDGSIVEQKMREAQTGKPDAFYELGLIYSLGQGVDVNRIEAHKWLNLAVISGVKSAQVDRAELAAEMSAPEIAEAQRMAREWLSQRHH